MWAHARVVVAVVKVVAVAVRKEVAAVAQLNHPVRRVAMRLVLRLRNQELRTHHTMSCLVGQKKLVVAQQAEKEKKA